MKNETFGIEWDEKAEIECIECHKISVPQNKTWGCKPNLCDDCMEKGWIDAGSEDGLKLIENDPILSGRILRQSPYTVPLGNGEE